MYALLWILSSCAAPPPAQQTTALVSANPAEPPAPPHEAGAVVYVPVYSSIYVAEGNQTLNLTVTLSVRNTDREAPIAVTSVRYYDTGGRMLHSYVESPTQLAPLASADTVVRESDTRAGVGGSFIVEWQAGEDVAEPIIEAIMIGSAFQQGISFVSAGRVLERSTTPRQGSPVPLQGTPAPPATP